MLRSIDRSNSHVRLMIYGDRMVIVRIPMLDLRIRVTITIDR